MVPFFLVQQHDGRGTLGHRTASSVRNTKILKLEKFRWIIFLDVFVKLQTHQKNNVCSGMLRSNSAILLSFSNLLIKYFETSCRLSGMPLSSSSIMLLG